MTLEQSQRLAWVVGAIGIIGTALGWSMNPGTFPHAWLAALALWLGWPLGCLGLLLIHSLTGGSWGYVLRPVLTAGARTTALLVPAAIPWLLTLPALYPWTLPGASAHLSNGFYLNRPFFFGRLLIYLVTWLGLQALTLRALRTKQPDAALARIAPAGLILLALTITFSSIDLTMSLDPRFNSSVYGLVTLTEMGLFALSVAIFWSIFSSGRRIAAEQLSVLGKLLLGIVLLWAYLDFMQLLIAWESDLPADASWYLPRSSGGWGMTAGAITAAHFVLPWCALIWPQIRRSPRAIAIVAGLLGLSAIARDWWMVLPASGNAFSPVDVTAMLGLLGMGAAVTLVRGDRRGG